jgi:hypothetical protein
MPEQAKRLERCSAFQIPNFDLQGVLMRIIYLMAIYVVMLINPTLALAGDRDMEFGKLSPKEIYGVIKTALRDTHARNAEYRSKMGIPVLKGNFDPSEGGKYYDVSDCLNDTLPDKAMKLFGPQHASIVMAGWSMELANNLKRFGVPAQVWQQHLNNLDQIGIDSLAASGSWRYEVNGETGVSFFAAKKKAKKVEGELLQSLLKYRAQNRGKPQFRSASECGAGEDQSEIIGNAALVTFSYIPFFNFRVCQLTGIDPENQARCIGWESKRVPGNKISIPEVRGVYQYVAKLPGGASKRGVFYGQGGGDTHDTIRLDFK